MTRTLRFKKVGLKVWAKFLIENDRYLLRREKSGYISLGINVRNVHHATCN